MIKPHAGDTARLFFALWPNDTVRAALRRHAEAWRWPAGVSRTRAEDFHVTLHFLGGVARSRLPDLLRLRVASPSFALHLGIDDIWQHGIAVLRPHAVPAALTRLHIALADAICALDLLADKRDYRPHVTLARRAAAAMAPGARAEIDWPVDRFVLVESVPSSQPAYTVLAEYPLVADDARVP